jgi:hypothetical protein
MRMRRIAAVTAGLIVAGAVFGTIAGALMLTGWLALTGSFTSLDDAAFVLRFSFDFGGKAGAVLGPIAAWLLMRHVPLGLAVGGTTLGTLVGGVAGLIYTGLPVGSMLFGVAGFGISAIALRIGYPRREPRRLPS